MVSRKLGITVVESQKRSVTIPKRKVDWQQLLRSAIQRAETNADRRLEGLKRALVEGREEAHLRSLGIIHPGDLDREFPKSTT